MNGTDRSRKLVPTNPGLHFSVPSGVVFFENTVGAEHGAKAGYCIVYFKISYSSTKFSAIFLKTICCVY